MNTLNRISGVSTFSAALLLAVGAMAQSGGTTAPRPPAPAVKPSAPQAPPASTPLDRFKAMAGDWQADTDGDGAPDMNVNYRVISGGSAVVETVFAGQPHEMITVFTMDRGDIVCTHYCALGNQPHLKAKSVTPNSIAFEFVNGGNMSSRDEAHMDAVTFTWIDADHVTSQWNGYEKGKSEEHVKFTMTRAGKTAPAPSAPAGTR